LPPNGRLEKQTSPGSPRDRLANLGLGHAAIDAGGGYTYFNPQTGNEFSAVLGFNWQRFLTARTWGYRRGHGAPAGDAQSGVVGTVSLYDPPYQSDAEIH
jgi:hypothetical protein